MDDSIWIPLGQTNTIVHLPNDRFHVKLGRDGQEFNCVRSTSNFDSWRFNLQTKLDMVRVEHHGKRWGNPISFLLCRIPEMLTPFEIDCREVTNRDFKRFIIDGGYDKYPAIWSKHLGPNWRQIVEEKFVDQSGTVGPRFWDGGKFAPGEDDLPVVGVSWFEAAAYAAWANKKLPSLFHWLLAAEYTQWAPRKSLIESTNLGKRRGGPLPVVGRDPQFGIGYFGAYDLVGNVREWCLNEETAGRYYAMGGAWSDDLTAMYEPATFSRFARQADIGFRCADYGEDQTFVSESLPIQWRKVPKQPPEIKQYTQLFTYDRKQDFKVEFEDSTLNGAPATKVCYDAVYDVNGEKDRLCCYILLPNRKRFTPPYQVVVSATGKLSIAADGAATADGQLFDRYQAILDDGRALVLPLTWGLTKQRRPASYSFFPIEGSEDVYVKNVTRMSRDVSRTADLIQKLGHKWDLDGDRMALYGTSCKQSCWLVADKEFANGGTNRFQAAIFEECGLINHPKPPEVDQFTYASHLDVPLLMLNCKLSLMMPYKGSQQRMFDLVAKNTHCDSFSDPVANYRIPLEDFRREVKGWLEKQMGPTKLTQKRSPGIRATN